MHKKKKKALVQTTSADLRTCILKMFDPIVVRRRDLIFSELYSRPVDFKGVIAVEDSKAIMEEFSQMYSLVWRITNLVSPLTFV